MAQPYLSNLQDLVLRALPGTSGLLCRHFFSGAVLYANQRICASLTPAGCAFKLSLDRCAELIESGAGLPMRYFPGAPVKKGYVLFPDPDKLGNSELAAYLRECVALTAASAASIRPR